MKKLNHWLVLCIGSALTTLAIAKLPAPVLTDEQKAKAEEAKAAGADVVGAEDLVGGGEPPVGVPEPHAHLAAVLLAGGGVEVVAHDCSSRVRNALASRARSASRSSGG